MCRCEDSNRTHLQTKTETDTDRIKAALKKVVSVSFQTEWFIYGMNVIRPQYEPVTQCTLQI